MNILIIGGEGYIGRELIKYLNETLDSYSKINSLDLNLYQQNKYLNKFTFKNFKSFIGDMGDKEILKPTYATMFKPKVGTMYFFPSWLQHVVYPFRGEGERRTVAANFNCFPVEHTE